MKRVVRENSIFGGELKSGYRLQVFCESPGGHMKLDHFTCKDKVDAVRQIMQYKPSNGYTIYRFILEEEWVLV